LAGAHPPPTLADGLDEEASHDNVVGMPHADFPSGAVSADQRHSSSSVSSADEIEESSAMEHIWPASSATASSAPAPSALAPPVAPAPAVTASGGWLVATSSRDKSHERSERQRAERLERSVTCSAEQLEGEVMDRLAFLGPITNGVKGATPQFRNAMVTQKPTQSRFWPKSSDGIRAEDWLRAMPVLASKESVAPLPRLVEMLGEAGAAGMELGQIARALGSDNLRIDLLKLKAYLTCFPSRIVVAPKAKHQAYSSDGVPRRVDQVWLISS
jgi:hypothetical protein